MKTRVIIPVISVLCILLVAGRGFAIELGDPAPQLKYLKWVKGEPVQVKKGSVVVVEFWATWCGPCRVSIPHLTEVQAKYKDKGVTIVGVSTETMDKVKPFVDEKGDQMNYTVAIDSDGFVYENYMKAFGARGIPTAFIVDKQANIVWTGHPMADMEVVLEKVVKGDFDAEKYAKEKAIEEEKYRKSIESYRDYLQNIGKVDNPDELKETGLKLLKDAPHNMLNAFSWQILTEVAEGKQDISLALRIAGKACLETDCKNAAYLDTYALALFKTGHIEEALRYQRKAVRLSADDEKMQGELKATLERFEKAAAELKESGRKKETIVGKPAPVWNPDQWANLPDGKSSLNPEDLKGKVVFLYMFRAEDAVSKSQGIPILKRVKEAFADNEKVALVALQVWPGDAGTNSFNAGRELLESAGLNVPYGNFSTDSVEVIRKNYKTEEVPLAVIIAPEGKVVYSSSKIESEQAQIRINELLKKE